MNLQKNIVFYNAPYRVSTQNKRIRRRTVPLAFSCNHLIKMWNLLLKSIRVYGIMEATTEGRREADRHLRCTEEGCHE